MPKNLANNLAECVEAEIARRPEGIGAPALAEIFKTEASARSLGRLLQRLALDGRIAIDGRGRATRYRPPGAVSGRIAARLEPVTMQAEGEVYVPISGDSGTLKAWVRRPITQRTPVGYDRSLLDQYEPNRTYYLADAGWRARLRDIGRLPTRARAGDTFTRDVMNRLLIDLSWASSRLEGNTYTRLDTINLIEHSRVADGKDAVETQMILNHKGAIEFLFANAADLAFDRHTLMNLHALLAENLLADRAEEGRLRSGIVEIAGSVYRPLAIPQQVEELFNLVLAKASAIADPFEQAFFAMVHVPYLQPFSDANKRVSRLASNIPFIRHGLCPLSFVDVPERAYMDGTLAIYEHGRVDLLREVFTWAYERSCDQFRALTTQLPEPDPFRLRYRAELVEAVADLVRAGRAVEPAAVRALATRLVPSPDQTQFSGMVLAELQLLHEGNIARYRLRLSEFRAWLGNQPAR